MVSNKRGMKYEGCCPVCCVFLVEESLHDECGVVAGPQPPDGGRQLGLGEDHHAVGQRQHVRHPAQVLRVAAIIIIVINIIAYMSA